MAKSAATVATTPVESDPAVEALAAAAGAYMEQTVRMTDAERKQLEKEILGLRAKLRWTHITADAKKGYEARIAEIEARLRG